MSDQVSVRSAKWPTLTLTVHEAQELLAWTGRGGIFAVADIEQPAQQLRFYIGSLVRAWPPVEGGHCFCDGLARMRDLVLLCLPYSLR